MRNKILQESLLVEVNNKVKYSKMSRGTDVLIPCLMVHNIVVSGLSSQFNPII